MKTINKEYDLFISYASEDKLELARPLAKGLLKKGYNVFLDELVIKLGDSITQSINNGLANAKYGILIISPVFLQKNWTKAELNALTNMFITSKKKLLPIWHNVDYDDIEKNIPLLSDIKAAKSSDNIDSIIHQIEDSIGKPKRKIFSETNYIWNLLDFSEYLQIELLKTIESISNRAELEYDLSILNELSSYLYTLDQTKMTAKVLETYKSVHKTIHYHIEIIYIQMKSDRDYY